MARVSAVYEENNCKSVIRDHEPYLILNLEKFSNLRGLRGISHCDFMYIRCRDNSRRFEIFLVDLKNIDPNTDIEKVVSIINNFLDNKIPQTRALIRDLLNELYVSNPNHYGVLVLPKNVIDRLWENYSVIARIIHKFRNAWITACDNNAQLSSTNDIRRRHFPLK